MFTPVLAKHTKSFNLVDTLSVGVDRIQRNFEPMQRQVESWRRTQITDAQAKLILYSAFVDRKLDALIAHSGAPWISQTAAFYLLAAATSSNALLIAQTTYSGCSRAIP